MHRRLLRSIDSQNTCAEGKFLFNNLNPVYLQYTAAAAQPPRGPTVAAEPACNVLHARRCHSWRAASLIMKQHIHSPKRSTSRTLEEQRHSCCHSATLSPTIPRRFFAHLLFFLATHRIFSAHRHDHGLLAAMRAS
jgi:hypothetical protein